MTEVLYEDNNVVVCVKPAGVPSQGDKSGDEDMTVILGKITRSPIYTIHRLDKNVGGVMVYAKNAGSAADLSTQFAENKGIKEYLAVCCGKITESGELCDWLLKNGRLNISKIVNKNSPNAKEAKLHYEPLKYAKKDGKPLTLARIRLFTGRHHQIRVQMANAGFPLYADTKYNKAILRKRISEPIGLWSESITLVIDGKNMRFEHKPQGGIFNIF